MTSALSVNTNVKNISNDYFYHPFVQFLKASTLVSTNLLRQIMPKSFYCWIYFYIIMFQNVTEIFSEWVEKSSAFLEIKNTGKKKDTPHSKNSIALENGAKIWRA